MYNTRKQYTPDGDGGGTPPTDDVAVQEKNEYTELSAKDEATLTPEEKQKFEGYKSKYEVVYKDEKGNPLTTEQVNALKEVEIKVNAISAKPEDQRTPEEIKFLADNTEDEVDTTSIYDQVDELKGEKLDIDYGEVKPNSPEGIVLREQAIEDKAKTEVEQDIRARFPRAYALMLHLNQGGKEEDFFKPENQDFSKATVTEADKAGQEQILRTALSLKGNSTAIINAVITSLKDGGKLYETAKEELESLQKNQKTREADLAAKANQAEAQRVRDLTALSNSITKAVDTGFDGITIPLKDRAEFKKFIGSTFSYADGEVSVVKKLKPEELNKALKVAYFDFKNGDIAGLAERTAKTIIARKIKNSYVRDVVPKGTGTPVRNVPLSSL